MGGRLTMSDDSHGIAQVGTNYVKGFEYLDSLGVTELWTLAPRVDGTEEKKITKFSKVPLEKAKESFHA